MEKSNRDDKEMREGWIEIFLPECNRCSCQNTARCLGYECPKWNGGWAIGIRSHSGGISPIKMVRSGLSFKDIKSVYLEILEETRKRSRERINKKYSKK